MTASRILVLGSGAREHAIAARLARDPEAPRVRVAPGGPALATRYECLALDPVDPAAVIAACRAHAIDLVVVGPEAPLAAGIADALAAAGIAVFGPTREAARLESSKWFAKEVLAAAGVPTARAVRCDELPRALAALGEFTAPWVLKADGLAAGKGVCVTRDPAEARAFLEGCFSGGRFGASGQVVVVEEFLDGEEASAMAVCDGERSVLLPTARDFKRAFAGDRGPNTGGMGARAPHPWIDAAFERTIETRIVAPVLRAMRERGTPFRGLLYAGLMLTPSGPKVIEFNARFGDPETQAVLPLVGGSLGRLLASAAHGALEPAAIDRAGGAAVAVVIADQRYPESGDGQARIEGLAALETREGVSVCLAAVAPDGGALRITGGRAVSVVATGRDAAEAAARARAAIGALAGTGWRFRADVVAAGAGERVGRDAGVGAGV